MAVLWVVLPIVAAAEVLCVDQIIEDGGVLGVERLEGFVQLEVVLVLREEGDKRGLDIVEILILVVNILKNLFVDNKEVRILEIRSNRQERVMLEYAALDPDLARVLLGDIVLEVQYSIRLLVEDHEVLLIILNRIILFLLFQ